MNDEVVIERLDRLEDEVEKLRVKVVDGNGHDSLEVRMTKLEEAWKSQKSMLGWILGLLSPVTAALVCAVVAWIAKKLVAL